MNPLDSKRRRSPFESVKLSDSPWADFSPIQRATLRHSDSTHLSGEHTPFHFPASSRQLVRWLLRFEHFSPFRRQVLSFDHMTCPDDSYGNRHFRRNDEIISYKMQNTSNPRLAQADSRFLRQRSRHMSSLCLRATAS